MNQTTLITTENTVFNRQQSIYDNSTAYPNNSELLIVVWLRTASITTDTNFGLIESKIENSADYLKPFYDAPKECEEYILTSPNNVKIFFILPIKYTSILLENIHNLQVLHSIYIYDESSNKQEVNAYPKVVNVYTDLNILTDELSSIVYKYSRNAQLPLTIFKQKYNQEKSTSLLNKFAYFVDFWNPLFIDLLFDLPQIDYDHDKAKFIEQCRMNYRANQSVLKVIDEFENTYKPELSIRWYKRDSFVYRLLNKVMRQQNIPGILSFRFFILDLIKELNKLYHEFINTNVYEDNSDDYVYRGQTMFADELENLKTNLKHGTIISINSFFSASREQDIAIGFSNANATLPHDMKCVLFEIKITMDYKMLLKRKPFADVSFIMYNGAQDKPGELEVIFTAGSFFQVDEIGEEKKIEVTVTLVKLTLINEDDINIPIMKDYQILKSTKTIEGKLIRIGNLLIDHSLSIQSTRSKADAYYKALFNQAKLMMIAACLTGRAWVALKRGDYKLAIKLAREALDSDDKSNDELKITTLNCLGGAYSKLKNYQKALKYYNQAYDLSKPTDEKIASNNYSGPCIPIDKYAMYDNYRNISSLNIARIHQKKGDIQLAWDMFKNAVDCDMLDTTDFHCHTCMTIAESGTHKTGITPEEHNRLWKNWKSFLDLGLVDILKYRTPVVSGYLSLSHEYDFPSRRYNNIYCRTMAIDYFKKVEKQCTPYVSNHQYYLYTLQCYEHLAVLYQHWDNRSIDYYEEMIRLCLKYHPDDLENIIMGYKGIIEAYKHQQTRGADDSEDMLLKLCTDDNDIGFTPAEILRTPPVTPVTGPITPLTPFRFGILFQNIKPLNFAFGFYEKRIDPQLKDEPDLRKKVIYCHMKLAALYYDQGKIDEAKHSLTEIILLSRQFGSEMLDIIGICQENLSFINKNFDFIIQSYKNRLLAISDIHNHCTDEDNYCYIAYLYEKKNDFNSALEFLQKPIEDFEQYNYVCSHTIDCYTKLAEHYETIKHDKQLTLSTYEKALNLIKKHLPDSMITTISIIEEHLIHYFKQTNDLEMITSIYKTLCAIVQHETTDILVLYKQFKRILKLLTHKHGALNAILNSYDAFLNFILQIINPLTSQMTVVLIHFRDHADKSSSAIEIYQKLINLLFNHQNDMKKIIDEYETIAGEFLKKHFLEDSIIVYENLLDFVCQHHTTGFFIEDKLIRFIFDLTWKDKIIKEYLMKKNFDSAINLYYKIIHFLANYRLNVNTGYDLNEFILRILQSYDEIAIILQLKKNTLDQIMNIYQEQIEFLTEYQPEVVQEQINTIILRCQQFADDHKEQAIECYSKLVIFIQKYRLQYLSHLSDAYRELVQLSHTEYQYSSDGSYSSNTYRVATLKQRIFDYKEKAKNYLDNNHFDKAIIVYKYELLQFLLENHARDDEQIAMCYKKMASLYYGQNEKNLSEALKYYQKVIDIYETQRDNFYTDYSFELNPNVCRRYAGTLFVCYNCMATIYTALKNVNLTEIYRQKANDIYQKYKNQFQFMADPLTNIIVIELCPFVELNY